MFRREALRKGALKPVKAKVGRYGQGKPILHQGPGPQVHSYESCFNTILKK